MYRSVSKRSLALPLVMLGMLTAQITLADPPKDFHIDKSGNVTWGDVDPKIPPIKDNLPRNGEVDFYWTDGAVIDPVTGKQKPHPHPGYKQANIVDDTGKGGGLVFYAPPDPTITDWQQTVKDSNGNVSSVTAGAIQHHSPWSFFPLNQLPQTLYSIPDFASTGLTGGPTIYTAVNLQEYLTQNPNGPLNGNYQIGQKIDDLGISIVNGQIAGLSGIYFATTPFDFDPNSTTGYVPDGGSSALLNSADFEMSNGPIDILGIHQGVPEPGAYTLFAGFGLSGIGLLARRRRRSCCF